MKKARLIATLILSVILLVTAASCGSDGEGGGSQAAESTGTAAALQTLQDEETPDDQEAEDPASSIVETSEGRDQEADSDSDSGDPVATTVSATAAASYGVCYVSVDGYCSNKKIKLKSGDTAYTVLKRTGAKVSARNSQYGIYVEGINGLFEFDEGDESGWTYYVNGKFATKSASKVKIKKGDHVKWVYVTEF